MHRRRRIPNERGAAAVELAIVLPLLVMVVFGIIEFGRYYNATITITHAAREAVRRVALNSGNATAAGQAAASDLNPTVSVSASSSPCVAGTDATATVSYAFTYNIPFVRAGTSTVSRSARMKCGG